MKTFHFCLILLLLSLFTHTKSAHIDVLPDEALKKIILNLITNNIALLYYLPLPQEKIATKEQYDTANDHLKHITGNNITDTLKTIYILTQTNKKMMTLSYEILKKSAQNIIFPVSSPLLHDIQFYNIQENEEKIIFSSKIYQKDNKDPFSAYDFNKNPLHPLLTIKFFTSKNNPAPLHFYIQMCGNVNDQIVSAYTTDFDKSITLCLSYCSKFKFFYNSIYPHIIHDKKYQLIRQGGIGSVLKTMEYECVLGNIKSIPLIVLHPTLYKEKLLQKIILHVPSLQNT